MDLTNLAGLAGAPLVTALVTTITTAAPRIPKRLKPILTLGVAIAMNEALAATLGTDPRVAVFVGLITGLVASGLYSHIRSAG